jgi:uncharacterized membrane protein YjfL (UPF0719 family)
MNGAILVLEAVLTAATNSDPAAGSGGGLLAHLAAAAIYSAIGMGIFGLGIWIVNKVTPFSLRKELEEDQNVAVAILVGSMIIGISIIIASAILG